MQLYYAQTEGHIMPQYRRGGAGRANLDGSVPVLGRIGTSAPKGYVQTGTTIKSNKAGDKTFAIYTPIDQVKKEETTATTNTNTDTNTSTNTDTNTGTSTTVSNPYQGQIDELTTSLGTISSQMTGYTDTINTLRGQISTMQTDFSNQLKGIMDANTKALEDMSTQYQNQLREQQEAQELARQQRELAAQTAAANQARAGQQGEVQIGTPRGLGIYGGLAGFKRRGKIKGQASSALAISATEGQTKSPNKMLNV
jgi:hypothetical protein